jgi:hypothetical protein
MSRAFAYFFLKFAFWVYTQTLKSYRCPEYAVLPNTNKCLAIAKQLCFPTGTET